MASFRRLRTALGLRKDRPSRHVHIGRHTYGLASHMVVSATEENPVRVGAFCSVADGVQIHGETHHAIHRASTFPFRAMLLGQAEPDKGRGGVTIGNDVWLGSRAIVLSNLRIGDGAAVGAGAIVTRDVPPYAIVAGNPARILRYRFEPVIIEALLGIGWWDWPDDKIRAELESFYMPVEAFVARHRVTKVN